MSEIEDTLAVRGGRYGSFQLQAILSQRLKGVICTGPSWESMSLDKKEALEMLALKISRIITGDPEYLDNWHDILGYTQLAINGLEMPQQEK